MSAVAKRIKAVQFGEYLGRALGAWHTSVQLDDVAELAGERTTARILHAGIKVLFELDQIETRNRAFGHIDLEFGGCERAAALAGIPGRDEFVENALGLSQHPEVSPLVNVRA